MLPDNDARRFNENVNYTFFGVKRVAVVTLTNFTRGRKKRLISAGVKKSLTFRFFFFRTKKIYVYISDELFDDIKSRKVIKNR